jgi:predicted nuclease of predicted toxin-antitoxin system
VRLLANENIPGETVTALQNEGYDIKWVRTTWPGSRDQEILHLAQVEKRILITLDKDFGELAFREGLSSQCGIILLRITPSSPEHITKVTLTALRIEAEWQGHFAVVEENRVRITPLPR